MSTQVQVGAVDTQAQDLQRRMDALEARAREGDADHRVRFADLDRVQCDVADLLDGG